MESDDEPEKDDAAADDLVHEQMFVFEKYEAVSVPSLHFVAHELIWWLVEIRTRRYRACMSYLSSALARVHIVRTNAPDCRLVA